MNKILVFLWVNPLHCVITNDQLPLTQNVLIDIKFDRELLDFPRVYHTHHLYLNRYMPLHDIKQKNFAYKFALMIMRMTYISTDIFICLLKINSYDHMMVFKMSYVDHWPAY